ncbi:type IV secretion system protein [Brevundimonas sp. SORGH_AS_0993]|uniref:type IV secretion system protein n=1 Tax=Brevundimonas sp. SORGH_AS_0993 TaxID=3041794 RepID=UPI0027853663|nr:type IV secretion system protein [Brevundimonas sp. SORGH_AS_0993]MDQ1153074.1 type IV secretion system protein VirB5 [Brevundimonas sp. SORGH_AS_0993]
MRARIPFAAAAAALVLAVAPTVQAQQIVHDPRALAQMIEEARTTLDQLRALQTQVEQGRQLFESLNDLSGVNALASELGLPAVRNPLPDMSALRAAADGDLTALGDLADRADAIRRDTRLYTPPEGDLDPAEAYYRDSLERAGTRTARDLAVGEAVAGAADRRLQGLETLRSALDTAPNARAVLDLEARLAAEQALIQNEQVRLQGLALTQAAEARLEEQRARERAEAARTARMGVYERAFR